MAATEAVPLARRAVLAERVVAHAVATPARPTARVRVAPVVEVRPLMGVPARLALLVARQATVAHQTVMRRTAAPRQATAGTVVPHPQAPRATAAWAVEAIAATRPVVEAVAPDQVARGPAVRLAASTAETAGPRVPVARVGVAERVAPRDRRPPGPAQVPRAARAPRP